MVSSYYNLTNVTAQNDLANMTLKLAELDGGNLIGLFIVVLVFAIAYVALKDRFDSQTAMLSAGFMSSLIGLLLTATSFKLLDIRIFFAIVVLQVLAFIAVNRFGTTE